MEDEIEVQSISVGDRTLMSVEFVDALKADPRSRTVAVRVSKIIKRGDLFELWFENSRPVFDDYGNMR